jgi:hypothetical protein
MPTPQENLSLVEQASCLFLKMAGKMPTPQENLSLVEQASCLFLKIVPNASSYLHDVTNYN